MATSRHITAKTIVTRVMNSIALTPPASIAGSTQSIPKQMFALLSEVGQELMADFDWQIKTKVQSIALQAPTLEYDVPSDLMNYIDGTGWNFTTRLPMIGPLNEQQWQEIQARQLGGTTFATMFQVVGDKISFYFAPDTLQDCKISYSSRGWVQDADDATVYKDMVEKDGDIVLYDPAMIVAALELAWKKKKGFPTVDEELRYRKLLNLAKYNDAPRNTLSTCGRQGYPYLGFVNIPDTNYGS